MPPEKKSSNIQNPSPKTKESSPKKEKKKYYDPLPKIRPEIRLTRFTLEQFERPFDI